MSRPRLSRLRRVLYLVPQIMGLAQLLTVLTLLLIDSRRKKDREVSFPHATTSEIRTSDSWVTIYTRGRDLFDDMLLAIEAATDRIYFETYIWKSDEVGRQFKDALIAAAERGVEVCLVYDVFANLVVWPGFYRFPKSIWVLRHVPASGMTPLLQPRVPGLNHRKLLVIDGEVAFVGGYNIGEDYAYRWRDTHARVRGDVVPELENTFVDYWNATRTSVLPVLRNPGERSWNPSIRVSKNVPSLAVYPIRYVYMDAIDRAVNRIWLTHAYLIPDDNLIQALLEAAEREVDVRVIVPAQSNHVIADWLSRGYYTKLLRGGVRLFLYQDAMVHAKTVTIDGKWSTIGTANLDRISLIGNYEINIEIADDDVAAEMEKIFRMDLGNCREVTLQQWASRPMAQKAAESVLIPLRPLL